MGCISYFVLLPKNDDKVVFGQKFNDDVNAYLSKIKNIDLFYKNHEGLRKIGAYSSIDKLGWYVISEYEYSEIISSIHKRSFMGPFLVLILTCIIVLIFTAVFSFGITKQFILLKNKMLKGAEGDLSVEINDGKFSIIIIDEIDKMKNAFNKMIYTIRELNNSNQAKITEQSEMMDKLTKANDRLNAQQEEVAGLYDNLMNSNKKLEGAYGELRTTHSRLVEHENNIVKNINDIISLSSNISNDMNNSLNTIKDGSISVNETSQQMVIISNKVEVLSNFIKDLSLHSKNIDAMSKTINYIGDQTRLLALNAAIESSKAGAFGRGFSVIAHEVNKLSVQSGNASKQISELIGQIMNSVDMVVKEMQEGMVEVRKGIEKTAITKEVFDKITNSTYNISSQIKEITENTKEIAISSEEFERYLKEVDNEINNIHILGNKKA